MAMGAVEILNLLSVPKIVRALNRQRVLVLMYHPKNRSCHSAHASIRLAAQGTQHERSGHPFGG